MKKYIVMSLSAVLALGTVQAQEIRETKEGLDTNPLISVHNKNEKINFTIGARFMADGAYISSDFSPMKSGFALSDARIRTSLSYGENWYFYADFDFSYGKFKQKNIFLRYSWGNHSIKAGYFCEPLSMSYNTSRYSYHFITRPSSVNALAPGRSLGVAYKYADKRWFANQGVFAENKYNDQMDGFQGVNLGGRWLYKPINDDYNTLHIGASLRYARINTGEVVNGILQTNASLSTSLETNVDRNDEFLNAQVPWARNTLDVGAEALFKARKVFVRGEYLYKRIGKERPDEKLFENQLGGVWSWTTLESWQKGNPLRTSKFSGAYIEAGYLILGDRYEYDNSEGLLKGNRGKNTLEVVARYNYTNLNDINDGDLFLPGRNQFYPGGVVSDYPATSTSIGGGLLHSATLGLNYGINQYVQVMVDYTFSRLNNVHFPMDRNFHIAQARLMVSF